jgi:hypothetical protein
MEMGMALVFDESAELAPAPPGDYGMCGAAGEYETISRFAADETITVMVTNSTTHTVIIKTSSSQDFVHASVFQILISFVVFLALVAMVSLFCVWFSRRKVHGMFLSLETPNAQESNEVSNPLSAHHLVGAIASSPGDVESAVEMLSPRGNSVRRGRPDPGRKGIQTDNKAGDNMRCFVLE